jgi:hypothetical protein
MVERINLMDLQKKNIDMDELKKQYGFSNDNIKQLESVSILTFVQDEKDAERVYSKLSNGGIVFRHHDGGQIIRPGETWVVELELKGTTYFAKGIARLDAQFFFDLRTDQVDLIAQTIWESQRSLLEPSLEERYRQDLIEEAADAANKKVQKETQKIKKERDQAKEELKELADKYKRALKLVEKYKKKSKEQVVSKESPVDTTEHSIESAPVMIGSGFCTSHVEVRRSGPDFLESPQFIHRHYFVHVGSDQSILTIRPHDRGNVLCIDGKIQLQGLSMISSYSGPADVPAGYSPKYGGFVVYLRYNPSTLRENE